MQLVCGSEDRDAWLEARRNFVCASDVPFLFEGMEPWPGVDIAARKRGEPEKPSHPKAEKKAEWGHRHEDCIARKFADETGFVVLPNQSLVAHDTLPIAATIDFDIQRNDSVGILECKTAYASRASRFRKPDLPEAVVVQVQTQLLVRGLDFAYVAWLLDGWDYGAVRVVRDDRLIQQIITVASRFATINNLKGLET